MYNSMHHEPTEGGNGDESIWDGPCGSDVVSRAGVDDLTGATCAFADGVAVLEIPPESVRLLDFGAVRQK